MDSEYVTVYHDGTRPRTLRRERANDAAEARTNIVRLYEGIAGAPGWLDDPECTVEAPTNAERAAYAAWTTQGRRVVTAAEYAEALLAAGLRNEARELAHACASFAAVQVVRAVYMRRHWSYQCVYEEMLQRLVDERDRLQAVLEATAPEDAGPEGKHAET